MKFSKIKSFIRVLLLFFSVGISSQTLPEVKPKSGLVPQIPLYPYGRQQSNPHDRQSASPYNNGQHNPHRLNELSDIQKRNAAMIYEDMRHYQRIQMEMQRQSNIRMLIERSFPSQADIHNTSAYQHAFNEIEGMLKGEQPMNLGRVVFLVENAYYEDSLIYDAYRKAIQAKAQLCNDKIKEGKYDRNNNVVKNMMLFSILTDTMKIRTGGRTLINYPLKYDLDDYQSRISFDSHFVTKLMRTGVGQCQSMPLYYLVLAEELGAEAYWSTSPKHSFVKIKDENEAWYNLELTCGAVLTDAHYMNSSYIKVEALQSRTYLEPLDKVNTIARMLIELAAGYYDKYGMDDFYLKCANTAAQYLANDLDALLCKAAYETRLTLILANLLQASNPEALKAKSPEAYKHFEAMHDLYKQIDDLGYEELQEGVYAQWLRHIAKLKEESEKRDKSIFLPLPRD